MQLNDYDDGDWNENYYCDVCDDTGLNHSRKVTDDELNGSKHRCHEHKGKLTSSEMLYALEKLTQVHFELGLSLITFSVGMALLLTIVNFTFSGYIELVMIGFCFMFIGAGVLGTLANQVTRTHVRRIISDSNKTLVKPPDYW